MTPIEQLLRRLALQDESAIDKVLSPCPHNQVVAALPARAQAAARLGALVALDAPVVSYQAAVIEALAGGVTADEVIGAIVAVAPLVGAARLTSATSAVALALGYDLDEAFEHVDPPLDSVDWQGFRDGRH